VTPETGMATGNAMHHAIPVRDTGATPNPDLEMVKRFAAMGPSWRDSRRSARVMSSISS